MSKDYCECQLLEKTYQSTQGLYLRSVVKQFGKGDLELAFATSIFMRDHFRYGSEQCPGAFSKMVDSTL